MLPPGEGEGLPPPRLMELGVAASEHGNDEADHEDAGEDTDKQRGHRFERGHVEGDAGEIEVGVCRIGEEHGGTDGQHEHGGALDGAILEHGRQVGHEHGFGCDGVVDQGQEQHHHLHLQFLHWVPPQCVTGLFPIV